MAFGLPKVSDLTAQLNTKFEELISHLQIMEGILGEILGELRTQRGGPAK